MQIQIESTPEITTLNGVPCRRWQGVTAAGVKCEVYVARISTPGDQDLAEFERDLLQQDPPKIS